MSAPLEIAQLTRPCRGEVVCGDHILIRESGARIVIALADGLGHGPDAAAAARAFCEHVAASAEHAPEELLRTGGRAIAHTRGAVAAVLSFDLERGSIAFSGVGNIELSARSRAPIKPISMPGILGRPVRRINRFDYSIAVGDLLVMHSDGVSTRFTLDALGTVPAADVAATLLAQHGKDHDDVGLVVVRVLR